MGLDPARELSRRVLETICLSSGLYIFMKEKLHRSYFSDVTGI